MQKNLFFYLYLFIFWQVSAQNFPSPTPYYFTENKGQIYDQNFQSNQSVLYLLNMPGLNVQLKKNGFSYDIYELENLNPEYQDISIQEKNKNSTNRFNYHRIDFEFIGSNSNFNRLEIGQIAGVENYYFDHIPNGVIGVKSFEKIIYKDFYSNIDLEFVTQNDSIKPFEYNFILHPGANVHDIKFKIKGAENHIKDGSININVRFGTINETIPASWIEGKSQEAINVEFILRGENTYGLEIQNSNNKDFTDKKIIIDPVPVRQWGTYFGVPNVVTYGFIYSLEYHNDAVYSAGSAGNHGMATSGTFQSSYNGSGDGVLAKFSSTGQRIWTTYCGSTSVDTLSDVAFDDNHNVYATGWQLNGNSILSTPGSHQEVKNNYNDAFIIKFNDLGVRIWGTYFGGEQNDYLNAIAVKGNFLYVGGRTNSASSIVTQGSHQTSPNTESGFFAKFTIDGERIWSSYFGGNLQDEIFDIQVDNEDNIIIAGTTWSSNNIAFGDNTNHTNGGLGDAFLAKFTNDGVVMWGTLLGGNKSELGEAISINQNNEIALVGRTKSFGLSTPGVYIESVWSSNNYSGMISKFSPNGDKLWLSYYGRDGSTWTTDVHFNENQEIIFCGRTESTHFIASDNGYDTIKEFAISKAYLGKFNSTGQQIWGTYYGYDKYVTYGYSMAVNEEEIYLAGSTTNIYAIATPGTFQPEAPTTDYNAFIVKFKDCESNTTLEQIGNNCQGDNFTLLASGGNSYEWYGPNGYIGSGNSIQISDFQVNEEGEYFLFIENGDCSEVKSIVVEVAGEEAPVPDLANLSTIVAVCSVTVTAPTATDDCIGTIIGTTNDPLFYDIPGTYTITWSYIDNLNNQTIQQQTVALLPGDDFMIDSTNLTSCETNEFLNLTSVESDITNSNNQNLNFQYYESLSEMQNSINPIANPENYSNPNNLSELYVKGSIDNCSDYTIIHLNYTQQPIANSLSPIVCDNDDDGIGQIILSDYITQINNQNNIQIRFYQDSNYTFLINPSTSFNVTEGDIIYVEVADGNCLSFSTITIELGEYTLQNISDFEVCADYISNSFEFNLIQKSQEIANILNVNPNSIQYFDSLENARFGISPLPNSYENQSNPQTIYSKFIGFNDCPEIISFDLVVKQNPIWNQTNHYQKCENEIINLVAPEGYQYLWSTGETTATIQVSNPADYIVEISNESCTITEQIQVINFTTVEIKYEIINENLKIIPTSDLNFKFSLDGVFWQNSPLFYNLIPNKEYTIWLKTESGCIQTDKFYFYDKIPNFLSPNSDGINDTWDVTFLRDVAHIKVFDRYGKIIFEENQENNTVWDGKYLGRELPSGNYWYIILFQNGLKLNGSILLKNY